MICGKSKILSWFEAKPDFPYWALYYRSSKSGGQPIARMREVEEVTKTEGIQELQKHLDLLGRGTYSLTAMPGAKIKGRGAETVDFEIPDEGNAYNGNMPQPAAVAGISPEEIDRRVQDGIDRYIAKVELESLKKELATLKAENKELQDASDDPMNKIAGILAPHLPGLLGIQTPGVAGLPVPAPPVIHHQSTNTMDQTETTTETTVQLSEPDQERLGEALGTFAELDPQWLDLICRMADKAKSNPSLIPMIKNFL